LTGLKRFYLHCKGLFKRGDLVRPGTPLIVDGVKYRISRVIYLASNGKAVIFADKDEEGVNDE